MVQVNFDPFLVENGHNAHYLNTNIKKDDYKKESRFLTQWPPLASTISKTSKDKEESKRSHHKVD